MSIPRRLGLGIAGLGLTLGLSAAPAWAASPAIATASTCYPTCSPTDTVPIAPTNGQAPDQGTAAATSPVPGSGGSLAFTGADIAETAGIAVLLIGVGGGLVVRTRSRRAA